MCVALLFFFGYLLSICCIHPQIGRAFEAPISYKSNCVATRCSSPCLLPIFLKIIIAKGKLFWKSRGFERGLSYLSQLVFILVLSKLGLDWDKASQRKKEELLQNMDRTLDQTHYLARPVTLPAASGHSVFKWTDVWTVLHPRPVCTWRYIRSLSGAPRKMTGLYSASGSVRSDVSNHGESISGPLCS